MMDVASADLLHRAAALVAVAASLFVLWWLERPDGRWFARLRSRFVLGVPWGSVVSLAGVAGFYLFAQHGLAHWYDPVTIPYSAWSYFSPLGMLTAPFAHSGSSHLIGNLTAALVVFPVAEYAFGHYPRERGSPSFGDWLTNPLVRAFVLFPTGVVVVGVLTSLFGWGPIIGFSGVVFAGVGFVAVRYPIAAVLALVARDGVILAYRVLLDPILFREASERFVRPGWAGIAVQGHALGLFLGAAFGVLVFYRGGLIDLPLVGSRDEERPPALHVWFGTSVLCMSLSLWAIWWYRGSDSYVLFRGIGLAVVAGVAALFTAVVGSSDRPAAGDDGMTRRQIAVTVLLIPLLVMALVAVPLNATAVSGTGLPAGTETVEVRDYTVTYAEDVPNQMTQVVDVTLFGETTQVNTSGVIVVNEERNIWTRPVSKAELASQGTTTVVLGGPTWRETVAVEREGWSAIGGATAYRVRIGPEFGNTDVAFTSDPATADAVLAGRNLSVAPATDGFVVRVSRNGSVLETAGLPGRNETVTAGGIVFERDGQTVVASVDGTRVRVFRTE